jgi:hypothetical protein
MNCNNSVIRHCGCNWPIIVDDYVGRIWKILAYRNRAFVQWGLSAMFMFDDVNRKISLLGNVLLQFTEEGGNDCIDVYHFDDVSS